MKAIIEKTKLFVQQMWHVIGNAISWVSNKVSIIAAICTVLLAIAFLKGINSMDDYRIMRRNGTNTEVAVEIWKKYLEVLRLNYSKAFIEETIGIPPITKTILYDGIEIENNIYINDYFTLVCCYEEKETLIVFLIIGNNPKFSFKNYRCPFELFQSSIDETTTICKENGVGVIVMIRSNNGGRTDNNSYYFECDLQHSRGGGKLVLIGYGICDIGYLCNEKVVKDCFSTMHKLDIDFSDDDRSYPEDDIRAESINSFMVFDEKYIGFIQQYIITEVYLGLPRDDFANSMKNYSEAIEQYINLPNQHFITKVDA